tara:strand:- start:4480 stop:4734 length:255 start_codon:yes stop_codon:yes gene_type:complete
LNKRALKVGDLVDFRSLFFGASSEKKRPGIIIEIENKESEPFEYHNNRVSCWVLWANGRKTSEWYSLLEKYDDIPRHSAERDEL